MKNLYAVLAVMILITAVMFGSGYVFARTALNSMSTYSGQEMSNCQKNFSNLDSGGKGYLSLWDFKDGTYGPGGHMGLNSSTGSAEGAFASADRKGDGRLTLEEYCSWKSRS